MTILTREEALRALDKISSDYDLAGGWSPDPMPLLATLRSYIEGHTGEPLAHEWHERFGLTCCKVCGLVRNENSDTKGCRGPVYVSLRDASPVQPDADLTEALTRIEELEGALGFYASVVRYQGPNQRAMPDDKWTDDDAVYRLDVTRDGGAIARATLTQGIKE